MTKNYYPLDFEAQYEDTSQKMIDLTRKFKDAIINAHPPSTTKIEEELEDIQNAIEACDLNFRKESIYSQFASGQLRAERYKQPPQMCPQCGEQLKKPSQCEFCAQLFCKNCCFRNRVIPFVSKQSRLCCEQCHWKFVKLFDNADFYEQKQKLVNVLNFIRNKTNKINEKIESRKKIVQESRNERRNQKIKQKNLQKMIQDEQKSLMKLQQKLRQVVAEKAAKMKKEEEIKKQQRMKEEKMKEEERTIQEMEIRQKEEKESKSTNQIEEIIERKGEKIEQKNKIVQEPKKIIESSPPQQEMQLDFGSILAEPDVDIIKKLIVQQIIDKNDKDAQQNAHYSRRLTEKQFKDEQINFEKIEAELKLDLLKKKSESKVEDKKSEKQQEREQERQQTSSVKVAVEPEKVESIQKVSNESIQKQEPQYFNNDEINFDSILAEPEIDHVKRILAGQLERRESERIQPEVNSIKQIIAKQLILNSQENRLDRSLAKMFRISSKEHDEDRKAISMVSKKSSKVMDMSVNEMLGMRIPIPKHNFKIQEKEDEKEEEKEQKEEIKQKQEKQKSLSQEEREVEQPGSPLSAPTSQKKVRGRNSLNIQTPQEEQMSKQELAINRKTLIQNASLLSSQKEDPEPVGFEPTGKKCQCIVM